MVTFTVYYTGYWLFMFVSSRFKPSWWLKNRHLQTIWGTVFRKGKPLTQSQCWRLELTDGDFIDVDVYLDNLSGAASDTEFDSNKKVSTVLLLHGLEGSSDSHYIQGIVQKLISQGRQVAVMHFRGCSNESNRLVKSYHSGVSDDLQSVIQLLAKRQLKIDYLVGFSLGGNVLLKWLGENYSAHQIKAAVAVSVPLLLSECANEIDRGFAKVYSSRLLKTLKVKTHAKKTRFPEAMALTPDDIEKLTTFWQFDEQVTAPLHGFKSASDYYHKVSSRQFLKSIKVPTLIIHAKDDPFMNSKVIPDETELSSAVQFELNQHGGHVGFVMGNKPWRVEYYLDSRIAEFLDQY